MSRLRPWLLPSLLVALGLLFHSAHAIPRIGDGAQDLRQVHHAMHDESLILERVWAMVRRGDHHHHIGAYPGLYPYAAGLVRLAVGKNAPAETAIRATRALSFVTTIAALLLCFFVYSMLAESPWVGAIFVFIMSVHPEIILWSSRVHPDAFALLFTQLSLAYLGFSAARDRPRDLKLATLFAGLSTATKLHGVFIMPIIGALIAWKHRKEPRRAALNMLPHAGIFAAVFIVTNPNVLMYPLAMLDGYMSIQTNNAGSVGSPLDWTILMIGPNGLGVAGTAIAFIGVGVIAARRRLDALSAIACFGVLYLLFLIPSIRMVQARYAFPAMWPLLFVGITVLFPKSIFDRPRIALAIVLCGIFLSVDRFQQGRQLEEFASYFQNELSPGKRELAQKLVAIQESRPGRVVSSPYAYVPDEIEWTYVWSLEDIEFPTDASAVLVDYYLYGQERGRNMTELLNGQQGFVATATIAGFVLFEKK